MMLKTKIDGVTGESDIRVGDSVKLGHFEDHMNIWYLVTDIIESGKDNWCVEIDDDRDGYKGRTRAFNPCYISAHKKTSRELI